MKECPLMSLGVSNESSDIMLAEQGVRESLRSRKGKLGDGSGA